MPKRCYFTEAAAKEAQRVQIRDWQREHLYTERRTSRRAQPQPRQLPPPVCPAARRVLPPARGSVAFLLFHGWRH